MRIAIVTGASSGIGREFAKQIPCLYRQLDEIWVIARRKERLLELELSVPVRIFDMDLNEKKFYEILERELKESEADIRMLVNSAGYGKIGDFTEIDIENQIGMLDINCKALSRMTHLCLNYMTKGSRIINVASAAAFGPQPGFAVYAASKSYVYSFSVALKQELKSRGIYVTAVCPGPVDTEFFDIAGAEMAVVKEQFRVKSKDVARQALLDAKDKKTISVYGSVMKGAKVAAKILPDPVIARILQIANETEDKE